MSVHCQPHPPFIPSHPHPHPHPYPTSEELQEQVTHAQQHLTQQQHVYETLRTERNATAKQLLDLRDDISSMRRKFKAMVGIELCG